MTITIPVLDFLFSSFICFLSTIAFYQGWSIYFKGKKSRLFIYAIILKIANLFGKENSYREWMSSNLTPTVIKMEGLYALIGGFLGFCGGALLFVNAISKIAIN